MIRFAWRQQRLVILLWTAAVAALVGYILVVGFAYQNDAHQLAVHLCSRQPNILSHLCEAHSTSLANDRRQLSYVVVAVYVLPCLGGVVLGAPLVAGELERKTNRLAWTQGRSRTAWLGAKWAVGALAVVLPGAVVAGVMAWWHVAVAQLDVIEPHYFDVTGIIVLAYALFAFALGVAAGTVLRRTPVAALATVVGFGLFRWWIRDGLRPSYLAQTVTTRVVSPGSPNFPGMAWWLRTGYFSGHHEAVWFQPTSHYWPFQWIEAGIFVGAALVLFGLTVFLVRRWRG